MSARDAFADFSPTTHSDDGPFWAQPDASFADALTDDPPTGDLADGGSYGGIPQALNGIFSEHPDAPPPSVPAAMAPADPQYGAPFPHKDSD